MSDTTTSIDRKTGLVTHARVNPTPQPVCTPTATLKVQKGLGGKVTGYDVDVEWKAEGVKLDRTNVGGFGLGPSHKTLGERLVRAINAGKVYQCPEVVTDVAGKTYVDSPACVMGKYLNADLTRLGF